ncbi:hypothetical protein J7T55_006199 [Diaporthe amygdali]|uniref:uncharacterized protein n=1 Tax=Phomopsis amygdali TaxID=1214568 RepID=UPI0022FEDB77|nr:uncharacterized protein J7T55_006199 [Diaporthe amygdali]KAJ0124856.1 hypothetical protein J7T55_006199 [Diaporthe amygdali]
MDPLPFEAQFSKALADNTIPGAVLLAKSKDGKINYTKSFGPWDETTILRLASMTKLLTSVAAAKAIEQDLITLDSDIAPHLPTLAAQPILAGFSAAGEPILRKREKTITLRHLLSHSYGQAYTFLDTEVTGRYAQSVGKDPGLDSVMGRRSVEDTFDYPLVAEPGEGWAYGPGLDWAGRLVEVVSGVTLEEFMRAHIFAPLGVENITFFPARLPGGAGKVAALSIRDGQTGKAIPAPPEAAGVDPAEVKHCMGGGGMFAAMGDYLKVVKSILDDDERVLNRDTARLLFAPLLSDDGKDRATLVEAFRHIDWIVGWTPEPAEAYSWSLAGLLTPGGNAHRRKGFLQWSGAYNLSWFIDREAGLTALFATSFLPSGDTQVKELMKAYELGLYEQLES